MKTKGVAILLAFFLGGFGVHKFYLGRTGAGLMYLFFCWTLIPAFLAIVDVFLLAFMPKHEFDWKYNH